MYRKKFSFKPSVSKYTIEDCIAVVKKFHAEFGRVPIGNDIVTLYKKGKSPSLGIFQDKGGLNYVIKRAELEVVNKRFVCYDPREVRLKFRKFVSDFRANNDRFPTAQECEKGIGINNITFQSNTRMTYREALLSRGASPRTSKLANQASSAFK